MGSTTRIFKYLFILVLLALLGGWGLMCVAPVAAGITPTPTPTFTPTATPTAIPTATPVPQPTPTAVPEPTMTPTPIPILPEAGGAVAAPWLWGWALLFVMSLALLGMILWRKRA